MVNSLGQFQVEAGRRKSNKNEKSTFAKASVDPVASTGIEPVSGASETLILSIVLRGHMTVM